MDKLTQLKAFVRVAERASFSAVARDMRVTQSAVSKAIAALERELDVRLVNRSTRAVSLTEAGTRYCERCRRILADLEEAAADVTRLADEPLGSLNIAAPIPFGLMFISPRVVRFKEMHPSLAVNLDLDDRIADMVERNIDVAIRLGRLQTQGVVCRKLGTSPVVVVAAPSYLAARGVPQAPNDLAAHNCVLYTNAANPHVWVFDGGAGARKVTVTGNYASNNLQALKDAVLGGVGIAQLPLWMVDTEIQAGQLRAVLEDAGPAAYDIHAVFPSARQIPAKVKLFVDFIQDELGSVSHFLGMRRTASAAAQQR